MLGLAESATEVRMTLTPVMWSILEKARDKPRIVLHPDEVGPARRLEGEGLLKMLQSADWWIMATLTDAGREALATRDAS
jgi:hypothetical protein